MYIRRNALPQEVGGISRDTHPRATYSHRNVGWIHDANFQASVAPEMENLGLLKVDVERIVDLNVPSRSASLTLMFVPHCLPERQRISLAMLNILQQQNLPAP